MRYRSEHRGSIEIQPDFFSQYPAPQMLPVTIVVMGMVKRNQVLF